MKNNMIFRNIETIINYNMMQYGSYVIKNRAIPSIEDGLKPVYRRILYAMHENKCETFTKSATASGYVFPYHPHGDVYGTMVGLTQSDNNITPLLDGKGNFGQHTSRDLAPAASRYTEIKLSNISKDIFKDLNRTIVNWIPNYDGTRIIPEVLPVKFPMILHIAQEGIAVGMSSRTPSFGINDICNAMIKYIKTGEKSILVPDFATKATIINDPDTFKKINYEGKGTLRLRAKASIDKNIISVTEIPYSTTKEAIIESIIKLSKNKVVPEITSIKDLTGLKGIEIEITCKKSTNMEVLLEKLYQLTPMEDTYSCNMNVISNGLPKVMGVWPIIENWIEWRINCLKNMTQGEIDKLNKELHIYKGFEKVVLDIDTTIEIIRNSGEDMIVKNLMTVFKIDEIQAEYVANMKLKNINETYIKVKIKKMNELIDSIKNKELFINTRDLQLSAIVEDLNYVMKNFGKERQTQIISVDKTVINKIKKEKEQAKEYNVTVFVTQDGYVKKVINPNGQHKLKTNDKITHVFNTCNSAELVIFSGTDAYKIKLSSLPDHKMNEFGEYIPGIIDTKDIVGYSIVDNNYKFILICYDNGKIAKVSLDSFKTETNRKKLAKSLSDKANVVNLLTFKDETEVIVVNKKGKEIELKTEELTTKALRSTQGVNAVRNTSYIRLKEGVLS